MIAELGFAASMGAAAACDLRWRRVPNALTVGVLLAGLVARAIVLGGGGVAAGLGGAAVGLAALLLPFRARWLGGGDVKLAIAAGMWLGVTPTLWTVLFGLAGGGVWALAVTLTGGAAFRAEVKENLLYTLYTREAPAVPRRARAQVVPLAVALGAAAAVVFIATGGLHA